VERLDQPVAVGPRVRTLAVLVVAVRLGEVDEVHPLARPALAVARAREQPVDHALVCAGCFVGEERRLLLRRRRQSGEVEGDAAQERASIGVRIQWPARTSGSGGRVSGRYDQWSGRSIANATFASTAALRSLPFSFSCSESLASGHGAPWSIQRRSTPTSSSVSMSPFAGIRICSSTPAT